VFLFLWLLGEFLINGVTVALCGFVAAAWLLFFDEYKSLVTRLNENGIKTLSIGSAG
jgi:hypothetical protein